MRAEMPLIDKKLARRYKTLKKRRLKISDEIEALRNLCRHDGATKVAKANTGNYDPSSDCYWYEFKCPTCEKFWTEDQ
jgi:hypothetical protein